MKNDLLKSKKVLAGVLSVLAVGTIGAIILTQEPETSDMKEIKTEQSGELKTSTAVKNGSELIFDENSKKQVTERLSFKETIRLMMCCKWLT